MSEGNPFISTAKEMSDHMRQLAEYTRGRGDIEVYIILEKWVGLHILLILQTKEDMIATAKKVAHGARVIVEYAKKISQQCTDTR